MPVAPLPHAERRASARNQRLGARSPRPEPPLGVHDFVELAAPCAAEDLVDSAAGATRARRQQQRAARPVSQHRRRRRRRRSTVERARRRARPSLRAPKSPGGGAASPSPRSAPPPPFCLRAVLGGDGERERGAAVDGHLPPFDRLRHVAKLRLGVAPPVQVVGHRPAAPRAAAPPRAAAAGAPHRQKHTNAIATSKPMRRPYGAGGGRRRRRRQRVGNVPEGRRASGRRLAAANRRLPAGRPESSCRGAALAAARGLQLRRARDQRPSPLASATPCARATLPCPPASRARSRSRATRRATTPLCRRRGGGCRRGGAAGTTAARARVLGEPKGSACPPPLRGHGRAGALVALERVAQPPRRPRLLEPRGRRIGQQRAPPRIRGRRALLPHLAAARLARRARRRRAAGGRDAAARRRALHAARRADGGGARGGTAARRVAVLLGRARARRPRAVRRAHARVVRRAPAAPGGARPLQCGGDALAARRAAPPVGALSTGRAARCPRISPAGGHACSRRGGRPTFTRCSRSSAQEQAFVQRYAVCNGSTAQLLRRRFLDGLQRWRRRRRDGEPSSCSEGSRSRSAASSSSRWRAVGCWRARAGRRRALPSASRAPRGHGAASHRRREPLAPNASRALLNDAALVDGLCAQLPRVLDADPSSKAATEFSEGRTRRSGGGRASRSPSSR